MLSSSIAAIRRAGHSHRVAQRLARSALLSRSLSSASRGFDPAQAAAAAAAASAARSALPVSAPSSNPANSESERDRLWKAAVEQAIKKEGSAAPLSSDGRPRIEKTAAPATRPFLKSSGGVERPEWMLKAAERNRKHKHPDGPTALRVALDDSESATDPEALAAAIAAAAAPAAPEPIEPLAENPRLESLWLLRVLLRHARALPEEHKREATARDIKLMYREAQRDMRRECSIRGANAAAAAASTAASAAAASSDAAATPAAAAASSSSAALESLLSSGYSRLSFLRMSTPKLQQPPIGRVPPYARARAAFGVRGEAQHQAFVYTDDGSVHARGDGAAAKTSGSARISNSQGVTDEHVKRHQALVERMNFRGPRWEGKSKF